MNEETRRRLRANFGDMADSLQCKAEVRIFDPLSRWELFLIAQDPESPHHITAIAEHVEDHVLILAEEYLDQLYNEAGEPMQIDREYRPVYCSEIIKKWGKDER